MQKQVTMSITHWAKDKPLKPLVRLEPTIPTMVQSTNPRAEQQHLEVMLNRQVNQIQQNVLLVFTNRNLDNLNVYLLNRDIIHQVKDG